MRRFVPGTLILLAILLVASLATPAAENPFSLKVQVDLPSEVTAQMQSGDLIQLVLRPQVQFGERTTPGQPIVLEKAWTPGTMVETLRFEKALAADEIYSLEMRIVRPDEAGRTEAVRYISALWKLPRRPVDHGIRVRMHIAHERDTRNNNVMITQDSDGVYRVSLFFA